MPELQRELVHVRERERTAFRMSVARALLRPRAQCKLTATSMFSATMQILHTICTH
jgi:hypothetical protein